jgi:hypothetical protein
MKILAIDCGVKNLAFCLYNTETEQIEKWIVEDISDPKLPTGGYIPDICIDYLEKHKELLECDCVIIEKQPPRNAKMRVMEAVLYSYFKLSGNKVETYSAKHKLSGILGISGKNAYNARKKMAITKIKEYLGGSQEGSEKDKWFRYFCEYKKKDDLADCYLMIVAYISPKEVSTVQKRILAKKPPINCEIKDYTSGQLKYVIREHMKNTENIVTFLEKEEQISLKDHIIKQFEDIQKCFEKLNLKLSANCWG